MSLRRRLSMPRLRPCCGCGCAPRVHIAKAAFAARYGLHAFLRCAVLAVPVGVVAVSQHAPRGVAIRRPAGWNVEIRAGGQGGGCDHQSHDAVGHDNPSVAPFRTIQGNNPTEPDFSVPNSVKLIRMSLKLVTSPLSRRNAHRHATDGAQSFKDLRGNKCCGISSRRRRHPNRPDLAQIRQLPRRPSRNCRSSRRHRIRTRRATTERWS